MSDNPRSRAVQIFKNVGMNSEESLELLRQLIEPDPKTIVDVAADFPGALQHTGELSGSILDLYVQWPAAEGADHVVLDGTLSLDQLKSLVWWMENHLQLLATTPKIGENSEP